MTNYRILYEKGVGVRCEPDGHWYYPFADGGDRPVSDISRSGVQAAFRLRPIALEAVAGPMHGTTLLLPCEENIDEILMSNGPAFFTLPSEHWFDVRIQELFSKMVDVKIKVTTVEKVTYILNAVSHHCQRLAEAYSDICHDFSAMPRPPSGSRSDRLLFSANYSPWFEFDALVTAARRAYDSTSSILWNAFGDKDGCPDSFYKTYPKCHKLPDTLGERLNTSWEECGKKITNYRDNVQHFGTMDFGMGSVEMTKLEGVLWTTQVFIPDNPEVRSRSKFEYNNRQDALSYGWMISCEVLGVISDIVNAVVNQRAIE